MSNDIPIVRVFLSSPGDVIEERTIAVEVIRQLADLPILRERVSIKPILLENFQIDIQSPQQRITNRIPLPSDSDIAVFIIRKRIGTSISSAKNDGIQSLTILRPDGKPYLSSTEFEFENAIHSNTTLGKPLILLCRLITDDTNETVSFLPSQMELVNEFFANSLTLDRIKNLDYITYQDHDEFLELLKAHLYIFMRRIIGGSFGNDKHALSKRVFISYSHEDTLIKEDLCKYLLSKNIDIWTDANLEPGTPEWGKDIDIAIQESDGLIAILSPSAYQSKWVDCELSTADLCGKRVFPLLIKGNVINAVPFGLRSTQLVDGRSSQNDGFEQLVKALNNYFEKLN